VKLSTIGVEFRALCFCNIWTIILIFLCSEPLNFVEKKQIQDGGDI
jgi:hypothetical protein